MASSEQRIRNPVSTAAAPLNRLIGKKYHDLSGTIQVVKRLRQASAVDGFELQNLAEWDERAPPRDEGERRLAAWTASRKYTIGELAALLRKADLPILSVHANRDVGICLCSDLPRDVDRGKRLIHEALSLAEKVRAGVCVLHLWDTWKEDLHPAVLRDALAEVAPRHPGVKAAVENVPTHLPGYTPFDLVRGFEWITLDLRWAALYDELGRFESVKERIANVHLSGRLDGDRWATNPSWFPSRQRSFGFYEALNTLRNEWGYPGLLTVEMSGSPGDTWENLVTAMTALQRRTAEPEDPK